MMMSRKTRWLITVFTLGMLLTPLLTGCQLAQPDHGLNTKSENLCGIFVTFGSSAAPQDEQLLESLDYTIDRDGNLSFDEADRTSLYRSELEGVISPNGLMVFEGIAGYYMGVVETEDEQREIHSELITDSGFYNSFLNVSVINKDQERSYDATLPVGKDFDDTVYVNPVYKRGDGTYYTILGQQIGSYISATSPGHLYTHTVDNTVTRTVDGITRSDKVIFKVNIAVVDEAKQIFIKEMNQSNEVIKNTEYYISSPEKFIVDNNTAYIIVEEMIDSPLGQGSVKRSIYSLEQKDLGDEMICHLLHFQGGNKLLDSRSIQFVR